MRVEQNKNNSNYIKVFVLEKNFLKVNLSSIMFVLILVSSEKQPLSEWNKIKTTATTLKSLCWKKNFLKVNLSSIMFVLILVSSLRAFFLGF